MATSSEASQIEQFVYGPFIPAPSLHRELRNVRRISSVSSYLSVTHPARTSSPALNRQIERLRKQETEQQRKVSEYSRIGNMEMEAYRAGFHKLRIPVDVGTQCGRTW